MKLLWQRARRFGVRIGVAAADLWARHWLLIIGTLLLSLSILLRWVNFPLSRSFNALQLSFINSLELVPQYHLVSYGFCAALVFATGLAALRFSPLALLLAATILMSLFVALPFKLSFEQPAILHRLSAETTDVTLVRSFTRQYLPENLGSVEDIPSHIELDTVLGRALAVISFLGLGWGCFGFSSLLISFYAFARVPRDKRVLSRLCLCLPVVALAILLIGPLIGQDAFVRARIAQGQGHNEEAIALYHEAMRRDAWFAQDINTYATIGDLQHQSNLAQGSAERHIRQAMKFKQAGQYELAIFELAQAANSGGEIAVMALREAARTHLEYGLALYRAGAIGSAITSWERSLGENPAQIQPLVYLARANYDLARYEEALLANNKVIDSVGLTSVLANAYSLEGDSYTRLGDDNNARKYYAKSIKLDNDLNLWATTGLVGN